MIEKKILNNLLCDKIRHLHSKRKTIFQNLEILKESHSVIISVYFRYYYLRLVFLRTLCLCSVLHYISQLTLPIKMQGFNLTLSIGDSSTISPHLSLYSLDKVSSTELLIRLFWVFWHNLHPLKKKKKIEVTNEGTSCFILFV